MVKELCNQCHGLGCWTCLGSGFIHKVVDPNALTCWVCNSPDMEWLETVENSGQLFDRWKCRSCGKTQATIKKD